jgi:hypothetical protein
VTALTGHHQAMITGMTLSIIALVLLIAGTLWLALALAPGAPRLAIAGAVLGVFGALVVLFENSVAAAAPAIASGLGHAQATAMLERVHSGAIAASSRSPSSATSASPCSPSPHSRPARPAGPPRRSPSVPSAREQASPPAPKPSWLPPSPSCSPAFCQPSAHSAPPPDRT